MTCGLPPIFTQRRRTLFARLVANGLAQAAIVIAAPLFLLRQMDEGLASATVLVLVGLTSASMVLRVFELIDAERLGLDFVAETRMRLFDGIVEGRGGSSHGVAMARVVNDLSALKSWVGLGLARSVSASLALGGCVVAASLISETLGVALVAAIALMMLAAALLARALKTRTCLVRTDRGRLANRMSKTVLGLEALQADPRRLARRRASIEKCSTRLTASLVRRMNVASVMRNLPEVLLPTLLLGIAVLESGRIDTNLLVALLIAGLAAAPLRQLLRAIEYRANFSVAKDRLGTALRATNDDMGDQAAPMQQPV